MRSSNSVFFWLVAAKLVQTAVFALVAVVILAFVYNACQPKDEDFPHVPAVKKSAAADSKNHPFSKVEGLAR